MIKLNTKYLGLLLKNPIIVASSGLTSSVDKIPRIDLAASTGIHNGKDVISTYKKTQ